MEIAQTLSTIQQIVVNFGLKLIGAFGLWWAGRWLISVVMRMITTGLQHKNLDPTLKRYLDSVLSVVLNIVLVIGILGFFGFETTSFAALLAAAGVAIGAAWSGLLSNFAAGAFLMVLRPFKVGDHVEAAGVDGTVQEIGLFSTTIMTGDNVPTMVGNSKIMGDTLKNYSSTPYRRVDRKFTLEPGVNTVVAIEHLKQQLATIPNVLTEPAPIVAILEVASAGTELAVRPYCLPEHYSQVWFDTNRMLQDVLAKPAVSVPPASPMGMQP